MVHTNVLEAISLHIWVTIRRYHISIRSTRVVICVFGGCCCRILSSLEKEVRYSTLYPINYFEFTKSCQLSINTVKQQRSKGFRTFKISFF